MGRKVLLTWSGGKDSVMALDLLLGSQQWEVVGLLTSVSIPYDRISMHGVRRELLVEQALSLGIPLEILWLEQAESDQHYEAKLAHKLREFSRVGVRHVAFGDIFLEELRLYRERNLARLGMEAVFPLWGTGTREAVRNFLKRGFRAVLTCVDTAFLDSSFLGQEVDEALMGRLPSGVDPCGENGEFHTFVYAGPLFEHPLRFKLGEVVEREGGRFLFQELIPEGETRALG